MDLKGRNAEKAAMERLLDRLAGGRAALACVSGEPGIGKTSLLRALGERADARRILVLEGRGAEFERSVPFGVFADALDDHLAGPRGRALDFLEADQIARLTTILPALEGRAEAAPSESASERHRTMAAMRSLLEALAARGPVALTIDDLHWADGGSLELVSHLIRRPPRAPVLLALAYRPLALAELAGKAQASCIEGAADELIEPGPLTREQAAELLDGRVPRAQLDSLMTETGGNPFYLKQLARGEAGEAAAGGLELAGVPAAVAGSLAGELERLPEDARTACQAAAVVGDPFEAELVAAASGASEKATLAAIDALVRVGAVHVASTPRRFRFRHPIVRRAAYESADPGFRLVAHRRLAAALQARGAAPLERAHHVEAAAVPGDAAAVALLSAAGHAAAGRAPAIAARWYAAAVDLLPASAEPAERIGLMVAMATAQGSAGLLAASRESLLQMLDVLPPELEALRLRILPFLALVGHMLGRHGEATAMLRRALAELGDAQIPEAAQLGIATAIDCVYEPDNEAMRDYAAAAGRAAASSGDPTLEAATAGVSALALYNCGEPSDALEHCERAVALLAPLTDGELSGQLEGIFSLAWAAMSLERYEDCLAAADRGLAISRATGQEQLIVPLTIACTVALTWRGELAEASRDADHLTDGARLTGVSQWIAWSLTLRGWIAGLAGDLDLAAECGEEACDIARAQSRPTYFVAHAIIHLAEIRFEQGRPEECIADLLEAAGGPGLPMLERPIRPRYYELLTRAALQLDRTGEARAWADRAMEAAAGSPIGGRRCEAGLAGAAVLLAGGDAAGAELAAEAAADAAQGAGDRVLAARALLLAARGRSRRDRRGAVALLEKAKAELEHCGAARLRDEAARDLRRLGRRVEGGGRRGRGRHGADALSRREREVADLVTDGLTNREIAARLFLSDKTVETHLSAVFRKLGVRGRAAIGTALWRGDGDRAA